MRFTLCISLLSLTASFALGTTYVVIPDGTGDFPTIQAAVAAAVSGDVIELTDGTFSGPGNRDVDYLGKAVTIRSASGDPQACLIDPREEGSIHRGFVFTAGEGPSSVLTGVSIIGPGTIHHEDGGAIYINQSSPTITNCIIREQISDRDGAGVYCWGGSPSFARCQFLNNVVQNPSGGDGAAVACFDASPSFTDCLFLENNVRNQAYWLHARGGGIATLGSGSLSLEQCRFSSNAAFYVGGGSISQGGGLYCEDGVTLAVENCRFDHNTAWEGGSIYCSNGAISYSVFWDNGLDSADLQCNPGGLSISSCTFHMHADSPGWAAMHCNGASPVISNTIIAFFHASVYSSGAPTPTLSCCDIFGCTSGNYVDCFAGQQGVRGNFSADPAFCDAANEDYTLEAHSPCLPGNHPDGVDCGLIGALGQGCSATPVNETSWGRIKALYRR